MCYLVYFHTKILISNYISLCTILFKVHKLDGFKYIFVLHCKTTYLWYMIIKKENKGASITLRTTQELKKKLELIAAKERRSLSAIVEMILEKAIKEKK